MKSELGEMFNNRALSSDNNAICNGDMSMSIQESEFHH